jgi:hypothetical protein
MVLTRMVLMHRPYAGMNVGLSDVPFSALLRQVVSQRMQIELSFTCLDKVHSSLSPFILERG